MKRTEIAGVAGAAAIAAGVVVGIMQWDSLFGSNQTASAAGEAALAELRIPADDARLAAQGAPLYEEACASCHGSDLEGAPDWKQPLADGSYPAPPHDETGHTWHHPDGFLFAYTKLGGQPFMPDGRKSGMPGFAERYSDQQILAILAYIKSTWPEDAVAQQARITERASGG